ncbi:hypothetical protein RB195_024236 [Necator americanus]|uniref:Uncharacterized protein n=1 Tax=Necator americanus TaxID=51031 RepID=A0ABR1EMD0_NECAM
MATEVSQAEQMYDRIRRNIWKDRSLAKDDDYERRPGLDCLIFAQRKKYIRMFQLCLPKSTNEHEERLSLELSRSKRAAREAYESIEDVVEKNINNSLCAHILISPHFLL